MCSDKFQNLCEWQLSYNQIVEFCSRGNKIWVWNNIDVGTYALRNKNKLLELDQIVQKDSITFFIDFQFSTHELLSKSIKNLTFKVQPYNWFFAMPRILNATVSKQNCTKDFLLTTVIREDNLHRKILKTQMEKIPGLLHRGHVNFTTPNNNDTVSKWLGDHPHQHDGKEGFPSMDLYLDSWLEIVPETLYKNAYYFTEKTTKPIATKTPFLIVSTRYYLEYLRTQGFKTFEGIIDESYDCQPKIQTRVEMLLEQLQDIIKNGSEAFYNECLPILEHNQNRLLEISGKRQYVIDLFIQENLQDTGIK
jgi:hypothetical protein